MEKKILLVEDDLFIRELYEKVLKESGFAMSLAADGEEGMLALKQMPDLVLLDIMMPKLNGIDMLRQMKKDEALKKIPVILLSNLGQESIIKEAVHLGAANFLMKMRLTPYQLVDAVKDYFANPDRKIDIAALNLD